MFTIKSVSDEGTYYLVNHWNKAGTFWKSASQIRRSDMFKTAGQAKASLTKLLKVMDDYATDTFSIIETDDTDKIISEIDL